MVGEDTAQGELEPIGNPDLQAPGPPLGGIVWSMALNAIVPVLLYKVFKRYVSQSELSALVVATAFPLGKSIFDVARRGQVDPVSIVVLLGIATDCIALLFGGSARLLLVRESSL